MRLKSFSEHSGWVVIKTAALTWLVAEIPLWAELVEIPEPWDRILTSLLVFAAATIRLHFLSHSDPTVPAVDLPPSVVATMSDKDQVKIEVAQDRIVAKGQ